MISMLVMWDYAKAARRVSNAVSQGTQPSEEDLKVLGLSKDAFSRVITNTNT